MQSRIDSQKVAPGGFRAMLALENCVRNSSGLEPSLLELVIGWLPVSLSLHPERVTVKDRSDA